MALLKRIFICFFGLLPALLQGQVADSTERMLQKELEVVLEEIDEDAAGDAEQITQFLQDLAKNPLNINTATVEELMQLPGITYRTAAAIVSNRRKNGLYANVSNLKQIKSLPEASLRRIQPYITARTTFKDRAGAAGRQFVVNPSVEAIVRYRGILETQDGYSLPDSLSGSYLGPQGAYYQRITATTSKLSLNLTQETDAGEPSTQPVSPDFRSMHLAILKAGALKTLVVGDFTAGFGQGLAMFSGGAFGKGREVIGAANRSERGIVPYRSAEENRFFRGVGVETEGKFSIAAFYSDRKWSASPAGDSAFFYPSLTGLNRTESERSRRDNLGITVSAARLRYRSAQLQAGISGYSAVFESPVVSRSEREGEFQGKTHSVVSVDVRASAEAIQFFAEGAQSKEQARAFLSGMEWYATESSTVSVVYRNYDPGYITLFGAAFAENSGAPQNEEGLYIGMKHQFNKNWSMGAYADHYRFPAAGASLSIPGEGADFLWTADYTARGGISGYVLVRSESKDVETTGFDEVGREISVFGRNRRNSVRLHAEMPVSARIRWRTRVEQVLFDTPDEAASRGFLMYQDFRYNAGRNLQFDARITFFDTESFDSRVYQFENDLLFVMSNTALSGRGRRFYLLGKWEPNRKTEIWMKYDITQYDDRTEIGSGVERISGNIRSRIGMQMRVRF